MASLDKYDKIYAKYSDAIEVRGRCDPPTFRDPPDSATDLPNEADNGKVVGLNSESHQDSSPEHDVAPLEAKGTDATSKSTLNQTLSRCQASEEPKLSVASRDDHNVTSVKQVEEESCREDNTIISSTQHSLNRFNAHRTSMRSIYGSPSAPSLAPGSVDPPSDDVDINSKLTFLTEKSKSRKATILFPSNSSESDHRNTQTTIWSDAANDVPHTHIIVPSPSSSVPMQSLAMKLISEQIVGDCKMSHDKCTDCSHYMAESSDGRIKKCVFCPINDFRSIVQGAVWNRVMASKRIQGENLVVTDGRCQHCYSPIQLGISCEVCPILDEVSMEVARAIGRGGIFAQSYCIDCRSQHVQSSHGSMQCVVCSVLDSKLGDQQIYKPRKPLARDATSVERYQDTLEETTQLLEKIQTKDNDAIQIQLDEELVKAKNAQSLLGSTIGNIMYDNKTSGVRTELKAELLKAKEAQYTLQKMLESSRYDPNTSSEPVEQVENKVEVDMSGLSTAISQREIDKGNVKEYIPPPKNFFERGIPKNISVVKRRGDIKRGTRNYTTDLKQSSRQEGQYIVDCCCLRIQKKVPVEDQAEYFDDGSIGTDDGYTVDISLNSYDSRDVNGEPTVQQSMRDKTTTKARTRRRWSFFDLCGRAPSFDTAEEQNPVLDESYHSYDTNLRSHRKFSFDNEEKYHRARARQISIRRDDDSSYDTSKYSNITPRGILRSARYRSQSSSFSVVTDDHSRLSHRGHHNRRRFASSDNSASTGSEYRRVSFYNNDHRDIEIDKLKTLTEEGDDSLESHPNIAVNEVRKNINEYKKFNHEMKGRY